MPKSHGRHTYISLGGVNLSTYLNGSEFDREADEHDTTTYGLDSHAFEGGLLGGQASFQGFYDTTAVTGPRAAIEPLLGTNVTLVRRPEGTGAGKPQDSVTVLVRKYVETSPVADFVTFSVELRLAGSVDSTPQA